MNKRQAKKDLKKQFGVSSKHVTPRYIKTYCLMVRDRIVEDFENCFLYGFTPKEASNDN